MRSSILLLAAAALAIAGAADAKTKAHRKPPPPPPRLWHYFAEAPSPFLQYSYTHIPDARRTVLSCPDSGVIRVEQLVPGRRLGEAMLVIDSGGQSDAADAQVMPDADQNTSGTSVSATFPHESPAIQGFAGSGALRLAVGAQTYILPTAPASDVHSFMVHCAP